MPGACEKKGIAGTTKLSEAGTIWEDLGRSGKIWEAEHWEMQTCTQRNTLSWTSTASLTRISESQHRLHGHLVSPSFHLAAEFNFIMIQDGVITCACNRKVCSRSLCANSSNSKNNRNWKTTLYPNNLQTLDKPWTNSMHQNVQKWAYSRLTKVDVVRFSSPPIISKMHNSEACVQPTDSTDLYVSKVISGSTNVVFSRSLYWRRCQNTSFRSKETRPQNAELRANQWTKYQISNSSKCAGN
jgi:hypothetical protein